MYAQVQAFENDPHMAAKAQGVVASVEAMLVSMRAKLDELTSQVRASLPALPPSLRDSPTKGPQADSACI